jgi:hypothetical protein
MSTRVFAKQYTVQEKQELVRWAEDLGATLNGDPVIITGTFEKDALLETLNEDGTTKCFVRLPWAAVEIVLCACRGQFITSYLP